MTTNSSQKVQLNSKKYFSLKNLNTGVFKTTLPKLVKYPEHVCLIKFNLNLKHCKRYVQILRTTLINVTDVVACSKVPGFSLQHDLK